jgi:hypothetical protein
MHDNDIAALVAYAAELDPAVDADDYTVERWTDMLRGINVDLDTARTTVRSLARDSDHITLTDVRTALLPLDPKTRRRWGTAIVAPNPLESDYQREQRRLRGLEKARVALAREPLPLEPKGAAGLTELEQRVLQAAAGQRRTEAEQSDECERCGGTGTVHVPHYGDGHDVDCGMCHGAGHIHETEGTSR